MVTFTGARFPGPSAVSVCGGTRMKQAPWSDSRRPSNCSSGMLANFLANSAELRTFSGQASFASHDRALGPAGLFNGGNDGENAKMDSVDVRQPGARELDRQ